MCDPGHAVHDICISSPNVVLLISFQSIVMDDVGVASHYFVTCWADNDIISRQKLDSFYKVHVKICDYQGLDV